MSSSLATFIPPHNLEAERTVLGAMLLDPDAIFSVAPILAPDDFFEPMHAAVYQAIRQLHDNRLPIDFVTVNETLAENVKLQTVGGSAYLAELVSQVPTAAHALQYAEIVRSKSLRRTLSKFGTAIAKAASLDDQQTTDDLLERAEQELLKLSRQSADLRPVSLKQLVTERYDTYVNAHEAEHVATEDGLKLGFGDLDYLLEGLEPGHLMILAGRPSMGKTALAGNIGCNVARMGKSVAIFSLEMTDKQLTDRIFANLLGVEPSKLKRGTLTDDEFIELGKGIDQLDTFPIYIDDCRDATLPALRSKARRQQMEHGLELLIIDYLQLIQVTDRIARENQTQRITHISQSLKSLARELQCPIIVLSQLSRACEQRTPPIPILSDLRDSGSLEQDADSVLMLYREGEYKVDCENPRLTEVYVRKNRDGATGKGDLIFHKEKLCFQSMDQQHQNSVDGF